MKVLPSSALSAAVAVVLVSMTASGMRVLPAAAGPAPARAGAPGPASLDGKTFVTQAGEKGKQPSNKDTIVFREGRFLSEGCSPYGFGDAAYQAVVEGAAIRFHAETRSPTHGTMVWDGLVRGDTIEATNTWTRNRWYWSIKREYWYKGQLKE